MAQAEVRTTGGGARLGVRTISRSSPQHVAVVANGPAVREGRSPDPARPYTLPSKPGAKATVVRALKLQDAEIQQQDAPGIPQLSPRSDMLSRSTEMLREIEAIQRSESGKGHGTQGTQGHTVEKRAPMSEMLLLQRSLDVETKRNEILEQQLQYMKVDLEQSKKREAAYVQQLEDLHRKVHRFQEDKALLVLQLEEEAKTRYRDTEDQLAHKNLLIDGMREEIEKLKDENASIRDKHSRALLQMSDTHVQLTARMLETPRLLEDDTSLSAAENSASMLDTLLSQAQWSRDSHATRQEIEGSKDSARDKKRQRDREREERLRTESERGREFGCDGFERRTSSQGMSRKDCHLPRSQLGFRSPTAERPLPTASHTMNGGVKSLPVPSLDLSKIQSIPMGKSIQPVQSLGTPESTPQSTPQGVRRVLAGADSALKHQVSGSETSSESEGGSSLTSSLTSSPDTKMQSLATLPHSKALESEMSTSRERLAVPDAFKESITATVTAQTRIVADDSGGGWIGGAGQGGECSEASRSNLFRGYQLPQHSSPKTLTVFGDNSRQSMAQNGTSVGRGAQTYREGTGSGLKHAGDGIYTERERERGAALDSKYSSRREMLMTAGVSACALPQTDAATQSATSRARIESVTGSSEPPMCSAEGSYRSPYYVTSVSNSATPRAGGGLTAPRVSATIGNVTDRYRHQAGPGFAADYKQVQDSQMAASQGASVAMHRRQCLSEDSNPPLSLSRVLFEASAKNGGDMSGGLGGTAGKAAAQHGAVVDVHRYPHIRVPSFRPKIQWEDTRAEYA